MRQLRRYGTQKKIRKFSTSLYVCLVILMVIVSVSLTVMASEQEEMKKRIQIINPRPDFSLSLRLDKGIGATYAPGEQVRIYFRTNKNSHVTLFGYDTGGNIRLLFPNQNQRNSLVEANQEYYVEKVIQRDTPQGTEYIQGFATTEPIIMTRELERRIEAEFHPQLEEEMNRFIPRLRGTLTSLPSQRWVSSEILYYQILERRPDSGQLRISSSPEGAEVYLNDRHIGKTPLDIESVQMGEYTIQIELLGHETWSRKIQINPGLTTFVSADLQGTEQYGSVAIRCNEDIARIYLNEEFKRLTTKDRTIQLEKIPAGFHDIRISLSGYHDWIERIAVLPNETVQLTVNLEKITRTGSLEITSNIDNALIYLDGDYQRKTSSTRGVIIPNILEGSHELRIVKAGYQDYVSIVRIEPDHLSPVDVQMQQEVQDGAIAVYCNEDDARIFINGIYMAAASAEQAKILDDLEEGAYEVTVIKEGYRIWLEEVYVYPGETISVFADLIKIESL